MSAASPTPATSNALGAWAIATKVFAKELIDALRDRKTLVSVLIASIVGVPLFLFVISTIVSGFEERAEKREIYLVGAANAPGLVNYLERQAYTVKAAPENYEEGLKTSKFGHAVVKVPADYAQKMEAGEMAQVEVVFDKSNRNAHGSADEVRGLVQAYAREHSQLAVALRGGSGLGPIFSVEDVDLASTASRGAQLTGMLPFFVLMAVLYGALNAALDTTAGERERASLEPLLATPASRAGLVMGKWAAVAAVAMLIACLCVLSFYPSQLLVTSDSLAALFQFGAKEGIAFLVALVPFAAALSALLMAVAIRSRTFKEAQAATTFVILGVNFTPLATIINPTGEQWWHLWVPGLAQQTVMLRVLKGEELNAMHVLVPTLSSFALAIVCLWWVTRSLKAVAVRG